VPNFQNPTGRTLPRARREAVAAVAARHGLWIAEDDPYGELRFEGEYQPWIAESAPAADRTVLLGSFSKIMAPGMRLGWLIAPPSIVERVSVVKQIADVHTSSLDQAIAVEYLKEGRLAANLERARGAYAERSRWLADAIHQGLPAGVLEFTPPTGGMFLWSRLHGHSAVRLAERALANGVTIVPGDPFFASPPADQHIRLSYSMVNEETAIKAVERLAAAIAD
jgi:2-aminoadipate transaminase